MANHQYVRDPVNLFDDDDDIDDDMFLRNNSRNYTPIDEADIRIDNLKRRQQEQIQNSEDLLREAHLRSIASTQRSLQILHSTEEIGYATAEELFKQRQQLENANRQLDDINTSLRFSQKHINGIKSLFSGMRNYLSGGVGSPSNSQESSASTSSRATNLKDGEINENSNNNYKNSCSEKGGNKSSSQKDSNISSFNNSRINDENTNANNLYSNHPSTKLRGDSDQRLAAPATSFNEQLDKNLDDMAGSLSRLKELSLDLNNEIENHNDLIDNITTKTENMDMKIGKQTKEMNKMLHK